MPSTVPTGAPRRVVLHVGTPKSGTTFLQRALWSNREALLAQGVMCPGTSGREMFLAAVEVREVFDRWGVDPVAHAGTWARLCQEARAHPGTSILSHEMLAPATPEQIDRAWQHLEGLEVHLVLTARDLGRQLVSEWQERVKNGSSTSFDAFARGALRQVRAGERTGLLWQYHDVSAVLDRWGSRLPPERIHLVVAPGPGAAKEELWWRFGEAAGFDATATDPTSSSRGGNQTLGTTQVALLRRVNAELDGRIKQPHYARVVKRQFAQKLLAEQTSPRPQTPQQLHDELAAVAQGWVQDVRERGYAVHGDLGLLLPERPEEQVPSPDEVEPAAERDAAVAAIAELLVEKVRRAAAPRPPRPVAAPPPPGTWARFRRAAGRVRRRVRRG